MEMRTPRFWLGLSAWVFLCAVLLVACGTLELEVVHNTVTPAPSTGAIAAATITPAAGTVNLAGLVFQTADALWMVGDHGEPGLLVRTINGLVSSDGTRVLYYDLETQDVWMANLLTGERRNLTHTPEDGESDFRWWTGRQDTILFSAIPSELGPGPSVTGYPATVDTDGGNYRILDNLNGGLAPAPDGQSVAYSGGRTGLLYEEGVGIVSFDPSEYGLTDLSEETGIGSPAWSPDGKKLAWVVAGEGRIEIGIFDLDARTARLVHPYQPPGMAGWLPMPIWGSNGCMNIMGHLPAPLWSPDGQWLAFVTLAQDPREIGLWVVHLDEPYQEFSLGPGNYPVWSPDGRWLAFQRVRSDGEAVAMVAEVGTWDGMSIDVPLGRDGRLRGWVDLSLSGG
jgi:Tol biopolymer transport system component